MVIGLPEDGISSSCFPYLGFPMNIAARVNSKILEKVDFFFSKKNIDSYEGIEVMKYISDLDFSSSKRVKFDYFYENILDEIEINEERKSSIKVKYLITIDKKSCPTFCEKSETYYNEMLLFNQPIFYFIFVSVEEIMDHVRNMAKVES